MLDFFGISCVNKRHWHMENNTNLIIINRRKLTSHIRVNSHGQQ